MDYKGCDSIDILKVSANSKPNSVAGAIAGLIRDGNQAEIQAVGAGAINQAIKSIAVAQGYLESSGYKIVCIPSFVSIKIGDNERTAIKLSIEKR